MRTTIDLPADTLRELKVKAAREGLTLKALIGRFVQQGLTGDTAPPVGRLDGPPPARGLGPLPVIIPATGIPIPALSSDELHQIELDEDLEKYERSLGR